MEFCNKNSNRKNHLKCLQCHFASLHRSAKLSRWRSDNTIHHFIAVNIMVTNCCLVDSTQAPHHTNIWFSWFLCTSQVSTQQRYSIDETMSLYLCSHHWYHPPFPLLEILHQPLIRCLLQMEQPQALCDRQHRLLMIYHLKIGCWQCITYVVVDWERGLYWLVQNQWHCATSSCGGGSPPPYQYNITKARILCHV